MTTASDIKVADRALAGSDITTTVPDIAADSFSTGIISLVGLNAVQKVVGLIRTVLFCWFLTDAQLGRWSLALGYLTTIAPLVVLSLPGTFGKYAEFFRQRGQLHAFLSRTAAACLLLAVMASAALIFANDSVSYFAFGNEPQMQMYYWTIAVMLVTIIWNYLSELLTSLRLIRAVTMLQFLNSVIFTAAGVALIWTTSWNEVAIMAAFGVSNTVAALGALYYVAPIWKSLPRGAAKFPETEIWSRILPFAFGVWVTNLLTNTFTQCPQFMLKFCAAVPAQVADAMVGQFYSSRFVPMIMVALGSGLGAVVLPYLSHDWEKGNRQAVSDRLNLSLKIMGLMYCFAASLVLLGSPLLFQVALGGRYNDGLRLLPVSLAYCAWFSMVLLAQNYLWCAEKTKLGGVSLAVGLVVNIALNWWLIPRYELDGAVMATAISHSITLAMVMFFSWQNGLTRDRGVIFVLLLPLLLCFGIQLGGVASLLAVAGTMYGNWVFNAHERASLKDVLEKTWRKVQRHAV